jgi:hypothetical protein
MSRTTVRRMDGYMEGLQGGKEGLSNSRFNAVTEGKHSSSRRAALRRERRVLLIVTFFGGLREDRGQTDPFGVAAQRVHPSHVHSVRQR